MKKQLTFLLSLGLLLFGSNVFAQDVVLWGNNTGEGDFDGGLNGWTTNAVTAGFDWAWEADATSNWIGNTISSPTAANGAMLFDAADFTLTATGGSPTQPYPVYEAELISPIIDCSSFSGDISVKFNQFYYALNGDTYFSYSIDGGATFSALININSDIAGNTATSADDVKRIALPGAEGSSQVQLKFTADIDFYEWIIDDVQLIEKEQNNIALASEFIAIASSYSMPTASVDTIRFLADVANIGANTQYNVTLDVDVVRASDNASVFTATNLYGTLMAGDTVENQMFSTSYLPPSTVESYTVTYTLSSDSTDAFPEDNTFTYDFVVSDTLFAKEPAATRSITPASDNAFAYGSTFYVYGGDDATNQRYVTGLGFGVGNPINSAGEILNIFLEKPANGSTVYDANGDGVIQSSEREVVAFADYTITGNETENQVFYVAPIDFNTGGIYALEENTLYSVMVVFSPSTTDKEFSLASAQSSELNYGAADFAAGLNGVERYSELLDVGNSNDYSTFGFIGNPVPAVRIQYTEYLVYTNNVELADDAFSIFPNPAVDYFTASIDLEEQAENARLVIYNVAGQVMETRNLSNIQNEQVRFTLDNYTSGTYFISIDTENGHAIKRFVVNK